MNRYQQSFRGCLPVEAISLSVPMLATATKRQQCQLLKKISHVINTYGRQFIEQRITIELVSLQKLQKNDKSV